MGVVQQIRASNAGRDPERLVLKYSKMRSEPFVLLRGACHPGDLRDFPGGLWVGADSGQGVLGRSAHGQWLGAGTARWTARLHKRADFIDSRTQLKDKKCVIKVDGQKALLAGKTDSKKVESFMADFAKAQSGPGFFKVLDVARRIAGTGSLGVERYVILVHGKGSPDGHYFLDFKASFPSSLARHAAAKPPKWKSEAHRIVEAQRRLQAVPVAFLQPVFIGRQACVLRELHASEDRVLLDGAKQSQGGISSR